MWCDWTGVLFCVHRATASAARDRMKTLASDSRPYIIEVRISDWPMPWVQQSVYEWALYQNVYSSRMFSFKCNLSVCFWLFSLDLSAWSRPVGLLRFMSTYLSALYSSPPYYITCLFLVHLTFFLQRRSTVLRNHENAKFSLFAAKPSVTDTSASLPRCGVTLIARAGDISSMEGLNRPILDRISNCASIVSVLH